jgi:hypothetical protein
MWHEITRIGTTDVTVDVKTAIASFLHAFDLAGQSARFDVQLPYQDARWDGLLAGQRASTERHGLADPRLRSWLSRVDGAMNGHWPSIS